jgi:hypothetical protein
MQRQIRNRRDGIARRHPQGARRRAVPCRRSTPRWSREAASQSAAGSRIADIPAPSHQKPMLTAGWWLAPTASRWPAGDSRGWRPRLSGCYKEHGRPRKTRGKPAVPWAPRRRAAVSRAELILHANGGAGMACKVARCESAAPSPRDEHQDRARSLEASKATRWNKLPAAFYTDGGSTSGARGLRSREGIVAWAN